MKPPGRRACILLMSLAVLFPCAGESYLLVSEEIVDGIRQPRPLPSREGIMAAVFESGRIIFDTGALEVAVDWDARQFADPLVLAIEGRADFVMAAVVRSRLIAEEGERRSFESRARFYLLETSTRELVGSGELELSNLGREEELPYAALQQRLGEKIGLELLRLRQEMSSGY
jgi:hypothetical protein